jgi:hypothetical protein
VINVCTALGTPAFSSSEAHDITTKEKKEANANQNTVPLATCFANKNASTCLHAQNKT